MALGTYSIWRAYSYKLLGTLRHAILRKKEERNLTGNTISKAWSITPLAIYMASFTNFLGFIYGKSIFGAI
jgi:hypothetical protein